MKQFDGIVYAWFSVCKMCAEVILLSNMYSIVHFFAKPFSPWEEQTQQPMQVTALQNYHSEYY